MPNQRNSAKPAADNSVFLCMLEIGSYARTAGSECPMSDLILSDGLIRFSGFRTQPLSEFDTGVVVRAPFRFRSSGSGPIRMPKALAQAPGQNAETRSDTSLEGQGGRRQGV